jgi:hypothetical protein
MYNEVATGIRKWTTITNAAEQDTMVAYDKLMKNPQFRALSVATLEGQGQR